MASPGHKSNKSRAAAQRGTAPRLRRRPARPSSLKHLLDPTLEELASTPVRAIRDLICALHMHQVELKTENEELRRSRRASEAARSKYVDLYKFAPVGYFTVDAKGVVLDVNKAGLALLGMRAKALLGFKFEAFLEPASRPDYLEMFDRLYANDAEDMCEVRIRKKDKTSAIALLKGVVHRDDADDQGTLLLALTDVSERKRTLEKLRESEDLFRLLVDGVKDYAILMIDLHGHISNWNEGAEHITGYAAKEMIGRHIASLYPSPDIKRRKPAQLLATAAAEGRCQDEGWRIRKDGTRFWADTLLTALYDEENRLRGFAEVTRDISARREMEAKLVESEARLQAILDHSPAVIYMKDLQGRYVLTNRQFELIVRRSRNEIEGRIDTDLFSPKLAAIFRAHDAEVLNSGVSQEFEEIFEPGGSRVHLVVRFLILDKHGNNSAICGIGTDITDRIQVLQDLKQSHEKFRDVSQRLESVREEERARIAREIHDELGQIFTALKLDIAMVKQQITTGNPFLAEKLHSISTLVQAATQSVRTIAMEMRPVVLDHLGLMPAIEWLTGEFQSRTGIDFKLNLYLRQVPLSHDQSTAVFRIVQEILTNIVRHAHASLVTITAIERGGKLIIEVVDNGRGIAKSELSDPKSLGLLGMQQRASLLGGDTIIKPAPGKGTAVTVTMPFEQPAARAR